MALHPATQRSDTYAPQLRPKPYRLSNQAGSHTDPVLLYKAAVFHSCHNKICCLTAPVQKTKADNHCRLYWQPFPLPPHLPE